MAQQGPLNTTLNKTLYLVDTTDKKYIAIDGESAIGKSANPSTLLGKGGVVKTDVLGASGPLTFKFIMLASELAGSVYSQLKWEVVTASAGVATARMTLDLSKERKSIVRKTGAPARSLAATASFEELLSVAMLSHNDFNAGDALEFTIEIEVIVASGVPGSTAVIKLHHDPTVAGNEAIVEVNV